MAPGLDKLNRAGLGAQSFGTRKTTGMSAQVTKNLANSSPATKSSLFSFKGSRMANFVPGRNVSENMYKYNYQNQRAALNGGPQRTFTPRNAGHVHSTNMNNIGTVKYNNTSYQNGMATANLLLGSMQLLNQFGVFDGASSTGSSSLGDKLSSAFSGIGGGGAAASAEANAAISAMQSQTTSDGLRQAISGAEDKFNSFDQTQISNYEQNVGTLESEIDGLESKVKTGESDVKAKENEVSKKNNAVTSATTKRDVAKQGLENALKQNSKCTSAYAEAKANLAAAKQTAESTPETIQVIGPDGTPQTIQNEPAYGNAQAALQKAQTAEQQAKQDLQMSEEEVNKMNEAAASAEKNLESAQEALSKAETEQTKAKEELKLSKEALEENKDKLLEKQNELEELKATKQDYDALKSEIAEQKTRLTELEQAERERASELTSDISDKTEKVLGREIDASDGMNVSEKIRQRRNEKDNAKIENMSQELDGLRDRNAKTNILADNTNVITGNGGEELREGTLPSGKKVYFVGTKEVTQAEYEALKPAGM